MHVLLAELTGNPAPGTREAPCLRIGFHETHALPGRHTFAACPRPRPEYL